MGERIKKIRKLLDLTQQQFGNRIGVKRNTIATYESGRNNPVDSVVSLICREFNICEEWLRTGEGEMFKPEPSGELDLLAAKYSLTNTDYIFIEKLLKDKKARNAMENFCIEFASAVLSDPDSADYPAYLQTQNFQNASIEEKLEIYKRSLNDDALATELTKEYPAQNNTAQSIDVATAEAEYEKSLGIAPQKESTVLSTTRDIQDNKIV